MSKSFTINGVLDERTKSLIRQYEQQQSGKPSLNSSMSKEGKSFLKEVYWFIVVELNKGDPRRALIEALSDSKFYITEKELLQKN